MRALQQAVYALIPAFVLAGCFSTDSTTSTGAGGGAGSIALQISVPQSSPFSQIAKTADITVSATGMGTMTFPLTVTSTAVTGTLAGIPAGPNRLFEVKVYDSTGTVQYTGSATLTVTAGSTLNLSITITRVTGTVNIDGTIVESPGWSIFDGFESATLNAMWKPYPQSVGVNTTERARTGTRSFKVTTSDYKVTFPQPMANGTISWWYWDNSGTPWSFFYALTDTLTDPNLTNTNLHVVTNVSATYSFYHPSLGYSNTIPRTTGWRHFTVVRTGTTTTYSIDGVVGMTVTNSLPIIGFQVAGAIIDDFSAQGY